MSGTATKHPKPDGEGQCALKVVDLCKSYDLQYANSGLFADVVAAWLKKPLGAGSKGVGRAAGGGGEAFWALKNLSFDLGRGEVLGIIGKNGAGKSTLLKILSEVTEPTSGRVEFYGKVASILEIGTGFHPELSGRENVYLSGAMLGMTEAAIKERYGQIVSFSGISRFMETPVKHYSSGMFIRLAFSVVSHLDADILLLDEVLSVGDSQFSIKSLNKIRSLAAEGKTIVIVSHDLGSIASICTQCLLLENGLLKGFGPPAQLVDAYMEKTITDLAENKGNEIGSSQIGKNRGGADDKPDGAQAGGGKPEEAGIVIAQKREWGEGEGNGHIRLLKVAAYAHGKPEDAPILSSDALCLEVVFENVDGGDCVFSVVLQSRMTMPVMSITPYRSTGEVAPSFAGRGRYRSVCRFPAHFFNRGLLTLDLFFINPANNEVLYSTSQLITFKIEHEDYKNGPFEYKGTFVGPFYPMMEWHSQSLGSGKP